MTIACRAVGDTVRLAGWWVLCEIAGKVGTYGRGRVRRFGVHVEYWAAQRRDRYWS